MPANIWQQYTPLPLAFYRRPQVTIVAQELLGQILVAEGKDGQVGAGKIVETEAYAQNDKACHAHLGKYTKRTEVMFRPGGVSYVYLCYGIHSLLNIVTNQEGIGEAVLIRAIEPIENQNVMLRRRSMHRIKRSLGGGPGILTQALGIDTRYNALPVNQPPLMVARGETVPPEDILASPRVGVDYAGEDADLPYRYRKRGNSFTSPSP